MSIDVASLVFEIDSTQAVTARKNLEDLEAVGAKVDASARRIKTATEQAGIGLDKVAAASGRATKAATEHAKSQGAVERTARQAEIAATRAAEREAAAWAKVEAALAKRNAALRGDLAAEQASTAARAAEDEARAWAKVESALERRNAELRESNLVATMKAEAAAVGALEARIDRLLNSLDPARAAQARLNAELQEAASLYKAGAISSSDYAKAVGILDAKLAEAAREHAKMGAAQMATGKGAKLAAHEVANLGAQFADVGVSLASGQALWLVAIQQGAQIGQVMGEAGARGVTFGTALGGVAAAAAPFVAAMLPLLAVIAAIGGGFAIATQQINEGNEDIAKSLGLTAAQMEKVKNDSVTMGDTIKATFQVAGQAIWDAFGPQIEQVGKAIKSWYDQLIDDTVKEIKAIVGAFVGGYEAIKATWSMLPAAISDAVVSAANFAIRAVEKMVNGAIDALNKLNPVLNTLAQMAGMKGNIAPLAHIDLPELANANQGAMRNAGEAAAKAYADGFAKGGAAVDSTFGKIAAQAVKNAKERILKEAGDAKATKTPKGAAAPRDQTDERTAQIEAMIQAALADELQARLGVTREIEARADLERQIARAQEAVKTAQIAGRQATLDEDLQRKRISQATHDELSGQLKIVASINARAAAYRERAINEAEAFGKAREAFDLQASAIKLQIDVLASQEAAAKYEFERRAIGLERLKLEQQLERITLEQVTVKNGALAIDELIAAARLAELGRIHENQTKSATGDYQDAYRRVTDALNDVSRAFESKDWNALAASIVNAIGTLREAFKKAGGIGDKIAAVAGIGQMIGGLVGGKAGGAISGAASGAMGGAQLGTMLVPGIGTAIGAIAGGILGGVTSLLGGDREKKRQKAQQEAADIANAQAIAQERANQQADLQLRILELSGDEVGALAMRREAELAALDGANRALAEHIHKLEDWAKAVNLAKDAVAKAEDDLRAAYEADRDRLLGIIGGVETARDRLNQAYQRERGAIEGTISSVRSLVDSLSAFRVEMDMMAAANDPSRHYGYASRQFSTASNDNLIERGRAFAEASQSASATDLDFQRDLAAVRRRTDEASKTAQTQLTTAERQLLALDAMVIPLLGVNDNLISVEEAIRGLTTAEQMALLATEELARLDAQVGALITINSSVLSVAQAISNLNGAISALASAQASKPSEGASGQGSQAVGLTGYVDKNADLAALYASGSGMAAGRTKEQFAAYHWERYGQAEGRTYTAFARGGDHMGGLRLVGEEGPELEATGPSRIYNARQTAQMLGGDTARLEALVETLTDKVEELTKLQRTDNFEIKRNTKDSADIMAKVTQGADTVRVKAA